MKYNTPLKFGFLAGVCAIVAQMLLYIVAPEKVSTNGWMQVVYLPVLFLMIFGGITYRKEAGNIPYAKGLLAVFIIAAVGAAMLNIFTYEILMRVIDPDLIETIKEGARETIEAAAEKNNLDYEATQKSMEVLDFVSLNLLRGIAWGMSAIFSLILSLIVALFIVRPDQSSLPKVEG